MDIKSEKIKKRRKREENKVIKIKTRVNPRNTQSASCLPIFMTFREEKSFSI